MHDQTLLQMIEDDLAPAGHLLELLQAESQALHGRDMQLMENILAQKQSLIVLLEQHGRKRSQLLQHLGLTPDHTGLQAVAEHSHLGKQLLASGDRLSQLLAECHDANALNGQAILRQQMATANQIRILTGGDTPSLYDSRGSTARLAKARPLSQA